MTYRFLWVMISANLLCSAVSLAQGNLFNNVPQLSAPANNMSTTMDGTFISSREWNQWSSAFLLPSGRIIDSKNNDITHSEGQGYGMMLAVFSNQPSDFERIWYFTETEMQLRDDGLIAWKWVANAIPNIQDINNATDGDILVAYALALAGERWQNPVYTKRATELAIAIRMNTFVPSGKGGTYIKPGVAGFDRNGLMLNLSYWIHEAYPVLAVLDNDASWHALSGSALKLLNADINSPLPMDWIKIFPNGEIGQSEQLNNQFGYDAIRIPLYLLRGNIENEQTQRLNSHILQYATAADGSLMVNGQKIQDPGYRSLVALLRCSQTQEPFPQDLRQLTVTDYYPTTLHLMVLEFVRRRFNSCLQ